jgi:hypothetical protein
MAEFSCMCLVPPSSGRDAETLCTAPPVDRDGEGVDIVFISDSSSWTSSHSAPALGTEAC